MELINYARCIKYNTSPYNTDRIVLCRNNDNEVIVSHEDDITGTLTKLAYYIPSDARWVGFNPKNLDTFFYLVRRYNLAHKVVRFMSDKSQEEGVHITKTFICFRRRVSINVQKVVLSTKRKLVDLF